MSIESLIRKPFVDGRFYEAETDRCLAEAKRLCASPIPVPVHLPDQLYGAVVPHAGWVCSGRVAGLTLRTIHEHLPADAQSVTYVMTGSVHTMDISHPALDTADVWQTPLGQVSVNQELRNAIAALADFEPLNQAHQNEHSLEVQLPFMQTIHDQTQTPFQIVPCMIPPHRNASEWGNALGQLLKNWPHPVSLICSIDLTHYGPNYAYTPQGIGEQGHQWAQQNDQQLLHHIQNLNAIEALYHGQTNHSTCGSGALAATISACKTMGATKGILLDHTDSVRELTPLGHTDNTNSVGYAGLVFG